MAATQRSLGLLLVACAAFVPASASAQQAPSAWAPIPGVVRLHIDSDKAVEVRESGRGSFMFQPPFSGAPWVFSNSCVAPCDQIVDARRGEAFGNADAETLTRSFEDSPALEGGEEGPVLCFRKTPEAVEDDFERGAFLGRRGELARCPVLSLFHPLSRGLTLGRALSGRREI